MALKQLLLSRKLSEKQTALAEVMRKREDIAQRRKELETREAELEEAVQEITEETTEEAKAAVDEAVAEFEASVAALEAEDTEAAKQMDQLEEAISILQEDLDALAAKVEEASEEVQETVEPAASEEDTTERSVSRMNTRSIFHNAQQRSAFMAREDVKTFVQRVKALAHNHRSVTGGELLIPEVLLGLIREQVEASSKLLAYVNRVSVPGKARQIVMGTIPEGVWTEMCGVLNELTLGFNDAEVDGYKVGGYVAVCNALLEDNDVELVSQIVFALGRAIGLALDKAILYGTGTKMPMGIVTRLAQTAAPADYPATARTWVDLHTTNVSSITAANSTGIKLFQGLINAFGAAKKKYGAGGKFWAMNEATHMKLVAEALNFNANGAIVAGVDNTMPVIGGDIVELDFIPDNVIIAGYGELYLLAERAGTAISSSEHAMFVEDKTVYKGTARYDGMPVIAEGFIAVAIAGGSVAANAVSFTADTANAEAAEGGN